MAITTIAFDLDDTLLNTTGLLVPNASKQAFSILISNGLNLSLSECESYRLQYIKNISHKDLFLLLAERYGSEITKASVPLAIKAFYNPILPMTLPLIESAENLLMYCEKKYNLYIVTAGFEEGQNNKIKCLNINKYFKKVFIVDSLNNERKYDAFQKILELEKIKPSNLLCVGNSLSSEIQDAKKIGAFACYFEFGENRGNFPSSDELKPDYHIKQLSQLTTVCKI